MNLHILAIGRKKTDYDAAIKEYQKRITGSFTLTIEILDPFGVDDPVVSREKESDKLLAKIKQDDHVIALDEKGRDYTTEEFSKYLDMKLHDSCKRIVFVIGGAYGLTKTVTTRANLILRLGALTLPHELVRLIITEQLYRATNLLAGGKYHHR